MFDELANNYDYNIHTHFLLNGNTIRADYTQRCINAVEDIATAKYVFIDEGSNALSAMPLRPETKIIQLWHGCGAFKKFGFSTADLIFGESRKEQLRHPFNKNYSLVTVSSPEVAWAYYEAMNIDEKAVLFRQPAQAEQIFFMTTNFLIPPADTFMRLCRRRRAKGHFVCSDIPRQSCKGKGAGHAQCQNVL